MKLARDTAIQIVTDEFNFLLNHPNYHDLDQFEMPNFEIFEDYLELLPSRIRHHITKYDRYSLSFWATNEILIGAGASDQFEDYPQFTINFRGFGEYHNELEWYEEDLSMNQMIHLLAVYLYHYPL